MRIVIVIVAALSYQAALLSAAFAMDFQAHKDHCRAGEFRPVNPLSGGKWNLVDSTAWAEAGECVNFPIETLLRAAGDVNVMTFRGVTRLDGTAAKPAHGQNELFHRVITYNARHRHIFCMSAQWPVEWIATVADGTQASPNRTLIEAKRIRGGDSNGAYLKKMTILIEYLRETEGQSSVHIRYEVEAPSQSTKDALGAITDYLDRLTAVASGKRAPGPMVDPSCPYEEVAFLTR
ncbi:MAG: hypothetical protein WCD20_10780 [Rhodomicrobium sp.]